MTDSENYDLTGDLIYVAGPYSAESEEAIEENVETAIGVGVYLMVMGHYPIIPHLTHYVGERTDELGVNFGYEDYMELDEAHLRACDALYLIDESPGANQEREVAHELNIPVYERITEVPEVDDGT